MLTSIRTVDGKIEIVDQLLLPHSTEYIQISTIEEAHDAIKSMKASFAFFKATQKIDIFLADQRCTRYCIARCACLCSQFIESARSITYSTLPFISRRSAGTRHGYLRLSVHRPADGRQPRRSNTPDCPSAPILQGCRKRYYRYHPRPRCRGSTGL